MSAKVEDQELQRLDKKLLRADVRHDRDMLEQLLAPDFTEIGASGRVYDRAAVIAALADEETPSYRVSDYRVRWLGDTHALATYKVVASSADAPSRSSLRSSVWRHADDGWRLLFHQGTLTAQAGRGENSEAQ